MSSYTYYDLQIDKKNQRDLDAKNKHEADVALWLHSRPEVGALNNGKFYIHAGPDRVYTEIRIFSKREMYKAF